MATTIHLGGIDSECLQCVAVATPSKCERCGSLDADFRLFSRLHGVSGSILSSTSVGVMARKNTKYMVRRIQCRLSGREQVNV